MENIPKISIITPSFNQGHFIEDTILSVIGQGYPNIEYIIMDGGSTDHTIDILKKYDKNISYWESKKDKGQANAINEGFRYASGDILMWLNSDDMLMPNVLTKISRYVQEEGDGLYFGNCIHFRNDEYGIWSTGSNVCYNYHTFNIEDLAYIIQPSSFWTRKVWDESGPLDEKYNYAFDWEWFIRVKKGSFKFFPLNDVLSMYRYHQDHKSGLGGEKRQLEILSIYEKYSSKYFPLYKNLIMEENLDDFNINKLYLSLYKLYISIKGCEFSSVKALKLFKQEKYRLYSEKEISAVISML